MKPPPPRFALALEVLQYAEKVLWEYHAKVDKASMTYGFMIGLTYFARYPTQADRLALELMDGMKEQFRGGGAGIGSIADAIYQVIALLEESEGTSG